MNRIQRVLAAAGLSFVASLSLAPTAAADNCDIFINPDDCQNTGWTIGTIATLAGGVAVATIATANGKKTTGERPERPVPPPSSFPMTSRTHQKRERRDERDETIDHIEIRIMADPPSVTVPAPNVTVRGLSVALRVHRDPGIQTMREVRRGRG